MGNEYWNLFKYWWYGLKSWMKPRSRSLKGDVVERMNPLVYYKQSDMQREYWANRGSLGSRWDLKNVWGNVGGGTVAATAYGNAYRTSRPDFAVSGLYTDDNTADPLDQPFTLLMAYWNPTILTTRWVVSGGSGARYLYATPTAVAVVPGTGALSYNVTTWVDPATIGCYLNATSTISATNGTDPPTSAARGTDPWAEIRIGISNTGGGFDANAYFFAGAVFAGDVREEAISAFSQLPFMA